MLFDNQLKGPRSVFGEILDWMLAPLVLLWPLSVALTFYAANAISDPHYDNALRDTLSVLARQVRVDHGKVVAPFTDATEDLLRASGTDIVYYQVRDSRGEVVAGSPVLSAPRYTEAPEALQTYYRDEEFGGESFRIAYQFFAVDREGRFGVAQLAESRGKREGLANQIVRRVILPQFAIVPLALLLGWAGLSAGIAPLERLRAKLAQRREDDMSPIDENQAPEEVQPLIRAFNHLIGKQRRAMEEQRRFVADAAHQLRTPIAGLKTQTQLALRQTSPAELQRSLVQMDKSVERMSHLIRQLLSFARTGSSAAPKLQPVDLAQLAREVAGEWVPTAHARAIDLGFEGPAGPLMIAGNAVLLHELATNLVDNALRYTPSGGEVTVRLMADASRASLEVEDTGIGIEPADRDLIFEPFYRVLGTGADGTGLGLSIVRSIANAHGGRVTVFPGRTGRGTCMRVDLPKAA